jgi:hypothetical protein
MTSQVALIPLRCVRCDTPVPADPLEVAWACAQCGQGLLLDEVQGLSPLEIHYSSGIPANQKGKPFWVAHGRVNIQRDSYAGKSDRIVREVEEFWGQGRTFVIPAYQAPLEELLAVALGYLKKTPSLDEGPVAKFDPATLSPKDLTSAAQFVVMAVEADRKDKLKRLEPGVELEDPVLWVLPQNSG